MSRALNDLDEEGDGANGANAVRVGEFGGLRGRARVAGRDAEKHIPALMAATFLNGLNISMNTIPMLKT